MLLLFISTFIMQTICNINLGNTNQRILKKSFSVPIDAFFWNQAIIDDNENLYVIDGTQPGGINVGTAQVEAELLFIASNKTQQVGFRSKAASDSEVPCFITGMETEKDLK